MNYLLTTTDNPFNPHTQWDAWYAYDESMGYHTTSYLARTTRSSPELSDALRDQAIDDAMDEIVENNGGLYVKVAGPDQQSA